MMKLSKRSVFDMKQLVAKTNVVVDDEKCVGCQACANEIFCPSKVFEMDEVNGKKLAIPVRPQECILCKYCLVYCPTNAIEVKGLLGEIEGVKGPLEAPISEALKYWYKIKYGG